MLMKLRGAGSMALQMLRQTYCAQCRKVLLVLSPGIGGGFCCCCTLDREECNVWSLPFAACAFSVSLTCRNWQAHMHAWIARHHKSLLHPSWLVTSIQSWWAPHTMRWFLVSWNLAVNQSQHSRESNMRSLSCLKLLLIFRQWSDCQSCFPGGESAWCWGLEIEGCRHTILQTSSGRSKTHFWLHVPCFCLSWSWVQPTVTAERCQYPLRIHRYVSYEILQQQRNCLTLSMLMKHSSPLPFPTHPETPPTCYSRGSQAGLTEHALEF